MQRFIKEGRMGTKVHCKSYLPGYYSMRNINEDPNGSWPGYYEDRTLNGQFCNGFAPRPLNGYLDYDKEALKQTMLRHEEIFRKQVLELHRLYRKQRDLMEELRKNEEKNCSILAKSSQRSPISSQMLQKNMEKLWQVDGYPSTGTTCSRATISGADDSNNHLNPLNGASFRTGLMLRENGTSQENQLPHSRFMKHPRKMFDLELPAEAYIDNVEAENAEEKHVIKPLFGSPDPGKGGYALQPQNDVKLTLGSAQNPCSRDETQKSSSDLQNCLHTHTLADLNEPLNDESCKEMATSSSKFPIQMYFQGHRGHQKSVESVSRFRDLQEDLAQDRYTGRDGSVSMHMERAEKGKKRPFLNNEFGQSSSHVNSFTSSLSNKNVRSLPEPVIPGKAQGFSSIFSPWQHQNESWLRENQYQCSESSDRRYHAANKVPSGLTVPVMPGSLCAPVIDYTRTGSPVASPWKEASNNRSHMYTAAQGFPCFGVSTPTNIQNTSLHHIESGLERWQRDHDFSSMQKLESERHFYSNGFCHGLQYKSAAASVYASSVGSSKPNLNNANTSYEESRGHGHQMPLNGFHCMDAKTVKGINLNLEPPNGFQNGFTPRAKTLSDMDAKKEDSSGGIPWLITMSPCREPCITDKAVLQESSSVNGHSQPMPSYCLSGREVEQKTGTVVGSPLEVMRDLSSGLKPEGTTIEQNETVAASSNSRVLGFPLPQRTDQSNSSFAAILPKKMSPDHDEVKNRVNEGIFPVDSSRHGNPLDLEKHIHTEDIQEKVTAESVHRFRAHINLNFRATSIDQLKSSESSSEDEIKLPSPPSARGIIEIDLEVPPTSVEEEQAPLLESAPQIDQLVQPVEPECREDLQTTGTLDEALARIAAEAIQMISLDKAIHLEDAACRPLPTASADTLHWFADMVTANGDTPENNEALKSRRAIDQESSDIDGMDYFEYMTLNLAETIVEEYCFRPMEEERSEEEEAGVAHLLLTRPRRGQARRRRQRRDFQRDILPGLASLSRQEVAEDMQIIGILMKASGHPWKAGSARRNAVRSRPRRQARGGRRPRTATTSAVAEARVVRKPKQSNKEEATGDGRSILGWGRTTKRCRRQRCPPGNPPPS